MAPQVEKILQDIKSLNDQDQRELRRMLDDGVSGQDETARQEQVRQDLIRRGLIEDRPRTAVDIERFEKWEPIPITGKPLSETIIEERR